MYYCASKTKLNIYWVIMIEEKEHLESIKKMHLEVFGNSPKVVVRSPGRINLIGEHTDYNDGFVFPAAINKAIYFVASRNEKGLFRFSSADYGESIEMKISDLQPSKTLWANYLLGVAKQHIESGFGIEGVDCVFGGNIPIGAGLSSSAAIETGFSLVLEKLFEYSVSKIQHVKMSQKAEHEYAGVMCGIMDQFAIVHGKTNTALKLDCRNLEFEYVNINLEEYDIILCDTKVKHSLASSEYNNRRKECEQGVEILKKYNPSINALRDVDLGFLQLHEKEFTKTIYKRCKYVIEENLRVNKAFDALVDGDVLQLGQLMFKSHQGLKNDFDVSCKELDVLEEIARDSGNVIGARMMGGGFGGCTINIVKKEGTEKFSELISEKYKEVSGFYPEINIVKIGNGTEEIPF